MLLLLLPQFWHSMCSSALCCSAARCGSYTTATFACPALHTRQNHKTILKGSCLRRMRRWVHLYTPALVHPSCRCSTLWPAMHDSVCMIMCFAAFANRSKLLCTRNFVLHFSVPEGTWQLHGCHERQHQARQGSQSCCGGAGAPGRPSAWLQLRLLLVCLHHYMRYTKLMNSLPTFDFAQCTQYLANTSQHFAARVVVAASQLPSHLLCLTLCPAGG